MYNESEAERHLAAIVEEHDAQLFQRVEFDSEAGSAQINGSSRYDLELVLKLATDASSVPLANHVMEAIEALQYHATDYPDLARTGPVSVALDGLTATVELPDGARVELPAKPEGTARRDAWLAASGLANASAAERHDAFRRLVIRDVREVRRYNSRFPPILVDGVDPWDG